VDDRRPLSPLHDPDGRIGSDAVPIAADLQHSAELDDMLAVPGHDPVERLADALQHESSMVVYCGSDQQVSEGFAIALRIMGVDANFLPAGTALATTNPDREDQ
jgi:hypothetical protein